MHRVRIKQESTTKVSLIETTGILGVRLRLNSSTSRVAAMRIEDRLAVTRDRLLLAVSVSRRRCREPDFRRDSSADQGSLWRASGKPGPGQERHVVSGGFLTLGSSGLFVCVAQEAMQL